MATKKLVLVGVMTSVTCILAPISIAIPISPVPITLGLFAVVLSVCLLGARYSTISCLLYLFSGFIGLPVFSGFTGGAGILMGPTGGYLLGYLFIPLLSNFFRCSRKYPRVLSVLHILPGLFLCYALGSIWLAVYMDISLKQALLLGVIPYIPTDLIKIWLAFLLGTSIRRRLHKAALL